MPTARRKSLQKQNAQHSSKSPPSGSIIIQPGIGQNLQAKTCPDGEISHLNSAKLEKPKMSLGNSDMHILIGKIEEYNRRIQLPTFHIKGNFTSDDGVEYEGALRFFLAHAENNFTKAVKLTNSTTWKTLKPILLEKFNLTEGVSSGRLIPILYAIKDNGESSVKDEDQPLTMALNSCAHIQFVLRIYQQGNDPESPSVQKEKANSSQSFFAAMKKKLHKNKSNSKIKQTSPPQLKKSHKKSHREPVSPMTNRKKRGENSHSSQSSSESRKKSNASSKDTGTLGLSAAANAQFVENLAKAGQSSKQKQKQKKNMSSSMSNMLAIDDTEEFITIHGDRADLGVDEVVIPIDGNMTVRDIIADVLEECSISLARVDDFIISDVIGRETEGIWLTDYSREMNDNEKPLLLISMMKPSEGLLRRFELKLGHKDDDTASHENSNLGEHEPFEMSNFKRATSTSLSSISNVTDYASQTMKFPTDIPYFITVQSFDPQNDTVLHLINRNTSIIGSSGDEDECNMRLFAPDILVQHCWICKVYDQTNEEEYKCVSIAPFPDAVVKINDEEITTKTNLTPGDIVTIGKHYVLLFKDPASKKNQKTNSQKLVRHTSNEAHPIYDQENWCDILSNGMSMQFSPEKQNALIAKIMSIMSPLEEGFKLTPSYLFALMLDHARHVMHHEELASLLLKISNEVQVVVLESTKTLQSNGQDIATANPVDSLHLIWANLQVTIFWMANSIEIHSHIADNNELQNAVQNSKIVEKALSTLADAITCAFQQTVYHLTMVLYPTLDTILYDNPFSRIPSDDTTMNDTLQTLTMIADLCNLMTLNSEITTQLFTYLYFFISTSLCNKLFEHDSPSLHYSWEEGVKIRKNVEFLENWAQENQLDGANNYLTKIISIADFLATSKQFILQASWQQFRSLYPSLSPSQLRHLLDNYDLGSKQSPLQWATPVDEAHEMMATGVMESFEDHPPLVLPTSSTIDMTVQIEDKTFQQYLEYLNSVFGQLHQSEDETDSGFDLGHSRSPTEVDDTSKLFGDHTKRDSRSSNNSVDASANKPYTPIFKKKKDTPPVRRQHASGNGAATEVSRSLEENSTVNDSSSGDEAEISSDIENLTIATNQRDKTCVDSITEASLV